MGSSGCNAQLPEDDPMTSRVPDNFFDGNSSEPSSPNPEFDRSFTPPTPAPSPAPEAQSPELGDDPDLQSYSDEEEDFDSSMPDFDDMNFDLEALMKQFNKMMEE